MNETEKQQVFDYLLDNPDLIIDAMTKLKEQLQSKQIGASNILSATPVDTSHFHVYGADEYEKLRDLQKISEYMGFVYILEYGNNVKIGHSASPYQRVTALRRQAEKYGDTITGRVAVSVQHTNYKQNENLIHHVLSSNRIQETELFCVSLEEAILAACRPSSGVIFKDETEQHEQRAAWFLDCLKGVAIGKYTNTKK